MPGTSEGKPVVTDTLSSSVALCHGTGKENPSLWACPALRGQISGQALDTVRASLISFALAGL